jgi:hypothetical protein
MLSKYAFRQYFGQVVPAGGRHLLSLRIDLTPFIPLSLGRRGGKKRKKRGLAPLRRRYGLEYPQLHLASIF